MSGLIENDPVNLTTALSSTSTIAGDVLNLTGAFQKHYDISKSGITIKSKAGNLAKLDRTISVINGIENLLFDDIEVLDSSYIDRSTGDNHSAGANIQGSTVELRDLIIHDTTIGAYVPNTVTEVILDGCIIYFNGWFEQATGPHGHGIYAKCNVVIRNCIIFSNANFGIHIYGTGNRDNVIIKDNVSFCTTSIVDYAEQCNILHANGAGMVWDGNCTYNYPDRLTRPNDFGYGGYFDDAVMINNYMPEGYTNSASGVFIQQENNILSPEIENYTRVISVRGRAHAAIYNWELLDSVQVSVSGIFEPGTDVVIINVADYFVDRQPQTVAANGTLVVDMRAISHTTAIPQGLSAPRTTFPEFGAFVIKTI